MRFYNRNGKLYLKLGEVSKSTKIDIGPIKIKNNKAVGFGKVELFVNGFIQRVEKRILNGSDIDEAITLSLMGEEDTRTPFAEILSLNKNGDSPKYYQSVINSYQEYVGDMDIICEDYNLAVIFRNRERHNAIVQCDNHWDGYISFLSSKGLSNSSIETYLAILRGGVTYAKRYMGIEIPFNASVKVIKTEPYTWPIHIIDKFLAYKEDSWEMDAAKLMIYTCLRPSDALKVRAQDFRQDNDVFYIEKINIKNQVVTKAPLPENIWRELRDCKWIGKTIRSFRYNLPGLLKRAGVYDVKDYIYVQDKNKIKKVETTIGEATSPKTLRKVGINRLAEAGVPEAIIRDFYSGHKSDVVFRSYYRRPELKKVL